MSGRRPLPRLHLITDDGRLAAPDFEARAAELLRAGGKDLALHLRGPGSGGARLLALAEALLPAARAAGALLLVNDRVDVALAAGADGVQLGRRGLAIGEARRLLGSARWIGRSVHTAAEGREALAAGADFLLAGTLFASASHPETPAAGTAWLREIPAAATRAIGVGGITPERVPEVLSGPAYGVAVIRAIWEAPAPVEALRRFVNGLGGYEASE